MTVFAWQLSLLPLLVYIRFVDGLSSDPLLLVVSLDGFWYKYLDLYDTPNLRELASKGARAEYMKNVYVTKTFPNHFTIATGLYEESHGIVGNSMYDPLLNETFHLSNTQTRWWDNGKVVPIWVANQLHSLSRHSGGMMWPGSDVLIHNTVPYYTTKYDPKINFTTRLDNIISWFLHPTNPANCVFFYYEQPDAVGHEFGPFSPEIKTEVERVDSLIGYLVESLKMANIFDKLNLLIVSDHGMAPVPGRKVVMNDILGPDEYTPYGTSPVWNILPKAGKEDEVYQKLANAANSSHFKVYKSSDIPDEYHYKHNVRVLPILVEADEGWELVRQSYQQSSSATSGNHGYNNSLDSMHPIFIAHGPAFKTGYISKPFSNVDLYPLMCYLLQIDMLPSNGSLNNVFYLLRLAEPHKTDSSRTWLIAGMLVLGLTTVGATIALVVVVSHRRNTDPQLSESGDTPLMWSRKTSSQFPQDRGTEEEQQQLLISEAASHS